MKDSEESGSGGINMYDNLTKDDIEKNAGRNRIP